MIVTFLPSCLCVKWEVWRLHVTSGVDDREVAKLLELSHFFHYNLVGERRIDYHFAMFLLLFVYVELSFIGGTGT